MRKGKRIMLSVKGDEAYNYNIYICIYVYVYYIHICIYIRIYIYIMCVDRYTKNDVCI